MVNLWIFLIFVKFVALSEVTSIDVEPCAGATGEVGSPCILTRGANSYANITVRFIPRKFVAIDTFRIPVNSEIKKIVCSYQTEQKHRRMKAAIVWASGSVDLPFRGMAPNACTSLLAGSCPTKPNEPVVWSALIPLKTSFPAVSIKVD